MRHRKLGRQFGRNTSHRRAMFRALAANLVQHERIQTTDAKAKELRRVVERLVSRAVRLGPLAYATGESVSSGDLARRTAAKREVGKFLRASAAGAAEGDTKGSSLVEKVFVDLARRFQGRPGGYTRILKLGPRRGDNAPMSLIEFVGHSEKIAASQESAGAEAGASAPEEA